MRFTSHKLVDNLWICSSFLLAIFYSSMISAHLLVDKEYRIDSVNDLANANDVTIVCGENSHNEIALKVS